MKVGTGAVVVFFVSPSSSLLPIVSALSVVFTSSPTVHLHPHRHSSSSSSSPACPLPIGFTTFSPLPLSLLRRSTGDCPSISSPPPSIFPPPLHPRRVRFLSVSPLSDRFHLTPSSVDGAFDRRFLLFFLLVCCQMFVCLLIVCFCCWLPRLCVGPPHNLGFLLCLFVVGSPRPFVGLPIVSH